MIVACIDGSSPRNPMRAAASPLTDGKRYVVYGIGIRKPEPMSFFNVSPVTYLIADDGGMPSFCDAARFQIVDGAFPRGWGFCFFGHAAGQHPRPSTADIPHVEGSAEGMIGYSELISDPHHYIGLDLHDEGDLRVFRERQREIDLEFSHSGGQA